MSGLGFPPDPEPDPDAPPPMTRWTGYGGVVHGFESRICLLPIGTAFSAEMLRLFPFFQRGVMPFPGGFYEQPNIVLEAMKIISIRLAAIDAAKARENE